MKIWGGMFQARGQQGACVLPGVTGMEERRTEGAWGLGLG